VAIIALGIGANTAIFSIVNAVLFRPQPYERAGELVNVYVGEGDGVFATTSYPEFREFRALSDLFAGTVAYEMAILTHTTDDGADVWLGEYVSHDYWRVLGLHPFRGRAFGPADDVAGAPPVAIMSYQTWQRRYGRDPAIVGATIQLNGVPVTIVGIGPKDYGGVMVAMTSEVWLPYGSVHMVAPENAARLEQPGSRGTWVRARLRPGVTAAQAQAAIDVVMRRLEASWPESNAGHTALVTPTTDVRILPFVDRAIQPVAGLLMAVVGLLLAIACSNLVNLLLARAAGRGKEIAIRLAVGAGRARLVRQLLVESLLLAVLGGAAGLAIAFGLSRAIAAFRPPLPFPIALDLSLDGRVLAFTAVLSLVTGALVGLAPALRASRSALAQALKQDEPAFRAGGRRFSLRNTLVVAQVAVSMVLLVAAGLFVRGLGRAQHIDPGFETTNAAILTLNLDRKPQAEANAVLHAYLERLAARPDVRGVALAERVPLAFGFHTRDVVIPGFTPPDGEEETEVDYVSVGPGYFRVLRIPVLRGRDFTAGDDASAPPVAIVSQAMARKFWGTTDVVGRRIRMGDGEGETAEIVGVAQDTKVRTLGESPRPYLYAPAAQNDVGIVGVVAATAGDPTAVLAGMRRELRDVAPDVPVFLATTMPQHLGIMLFLPRMGAALLSLFGALAILLASIGLYGVIAFAVAQRTRELGVRLALGASAGLVVRMVVMEGMALAGVGCAVGLALSLLLTRLLRGALYGVSTTDPAALGAVVLVLGIVTGLASYLPARRAAAVDPILTLRSG
jgi:putative ABC transport system permease protein